MGPGRCDSCAAMAWAADGELLTACGVCGFPMCLPLLRVRAHGQHPGMPAVQDQVQAPQGCLGNPPVHGDDNEDVDVDDVSDYNYQASGNHDQKQKIAERMLTWWTNSHGSDIGLAKYDSGEIGHGKYDSGEIPHGYIPSLTHSQVGDENLLLFKVIVL